MSSALDALNTSYNNIDAAARPEQVAKAAVAKVANAAEAAATNTAHEHLASSTRVQISLEARQALAADK